MRCVFWKHSFVPSSAKTLRVSYVGMKQQDVAIKAGIMKIALLPDAKTLDEVVVTAMGIKRSEKILGYAASTVKTEELVAAKSGSVMGGLAGKVAGVSISSAGGAGTSQKVVVRGYASFSDNQPLYVIDGVPMINQFSGGKTSSNSVDFGNSANDVNPDDVESVTVLKGASATALYGSRAANGVIMITTKRAQSEKLSVGYDGSFMASNVLRVAQTQDKFGQGWPSWSRAENGSWGPALDGRLNEWGSDHLKEPMVKPFSYVKDNMRNFYQTGFEMNHNVNVRYGTEKVGMILSYGNVSSTGVLPSDADQYNRNTFSFRGNMKLGKFSAEANINYVRKDVTRAAAGQGDDGSTMQQEILQHAVDIDFSAMKDFNDERFNGDNFYTWYAQNPYWVLANNKNEYQDDRVYGKIEMAYDILPGLKAIGRLGGDFTNSTQQLKNAKLDYTPGSYSESSRSKLPEMGSYTERRDNFSQIDATFFLNANYNINQDITLGGTLGWNLNQRGDSYMNSYLLGLDVPGWYNLQNGTEKPLTTTYESLRRTIGLFGQIEFGFKNYWFVNLSGRNDWSSTLPLHDNSFLYGGVNTSLILTELFPALKNNLIDFLKIRAAIGQTGNDAGVYRTSGYYVPTQIGMYSGSLYTPLNGVAGLTESNTLPNNQLKPEITTEWELGLSANLFDNRASLDVAYYNKLTKDQIISASLAPETRYTSATRNIGEISNKGVEIALNVVPIRTNTLSWSIGATFTKNWSEVKKLWSQGDKAVTEYTIASAYEAKLVAKVGEPLGVFQVPAIATVEDKDSPYYGATIVDTKGFLTTDNNKKKTIGSSAPDFVMGLNTNLKYKGFTLSAVADWHKGGYMYSYTAQVMHFVGNATRTVFNDRQPFVVPNSVKIVNGEYVENNNPVRGDGMYEFYSDSSTKAQFENFVIPKDFLKLREVVLTYTFPKAWISKIGISQLDLSFIGRNLFMWTPDGNNYVDPETTNYGNDISSEFGEFATLPSTRNIGGGIKVVF